MKRIVVNGANGYVASNFILKLLELDYKVVALVRKNRRNTAEERMKEALIEMNNGGNVDFNNLEVHDYSLFEEGFALDDAQLQHIFKGNVDYFHFFSPMNQ